MKQWILILLTWVSLHGWAQHPFYLQIFDEGKLAMDAGNWRQAAIDLEIAAFGFLEKEPLLAEAYVRLVLTHKALDHEKETAAFLRDANRILEKYPDKPAGLSAELWDAFLVASGRKTPPAPPIPTTEGELASYVEQYPENPQAWIALIDSRLVRARPSILRDTFSQAMAAHPQHAGILSKALIFSVNQDKGRGREELANKLLILRPNSSTANEVLGSIAVEKGAWDQAAAHFEWVPSPIFPKTPERQRQLQDELNKQRAAMMKANEPKEEPTDQEQADASAVPESVESNIPERSEPQPNIATSVAEERVPENQVETPVVAEEITPTPVEDPVAIDPTIDDRVTELEKLVKQQAGNPEHKFDLVNAYIDQGSLRKAKKLLAKLARRYNNNPRYAETYAHYQYAQGSYQVNVDNLNSFEKDLKGASAYYLGMSYYRLGNMPKAQAILQRLDPSDFEIPAGLLGKPAPTATGGGGFESQIKTTSQLSKKEAIDWLDKQANQGSWEQMNRGLGEIIAKYPTDQSIRFYQGRALMGKGAFEEAMPIFIELVGEGYEENDIFYYAGLAALEKGDMSVATYLLERAQANNSPFSAEIQTLLTRIRPKN